MEPLHTLPAHRSNLPYPHSRMPPQAERGSRSDIHRWRAFTVATASTSNIERNRYKISLLHKLNITTALKHFAGNLVPQHQTSGSRCAATHHVLIAAADIGGNNLQYDAMLAFSCSECEFREIDTLNLNLARGK